MKFSIIIPVFNEAKGIQKTLSNLQAIRKQAEIILVDGGSQDGTVAIATPLVDKIISSRKGRSRQMNTGAKAASGKVLIFLHADTVLPSDALSQIERGLSSNRQWGRFNIKFSGKQPMFWVIALCMNLRSRLSGISTGDQTLFVHKHIFEQAGQFPEIPIMEDIAICKKLLLVSPPLCLKGKVLTSSRRWEQFGITRTILLMWWLRALYYFGCDSETLARHYATGKFWKPSFD